MQKGYENLHVHTKTSDGELSYGEVLKTCAENNISIVAFTDHDSLPGEKPLKILNKNKERSVKWVIGVEISSGYPKEIGGPASNFHIVGLFVDPHNNALKKHCKKAAAGRRKRMEKMTSNLRKLGFRIKKEECLKESGGEAVGRPHIVAALTKKKHNLKLIGELKKKMAQAARKDKAIKEKYEKMIKAGPEQYPYQLFLSPDAFIPDVFVNYLYWLPLDESVKLIRKAGGIALLAHWSFSNHKVDKNLVEKLFKENRLDGAEVVFGLGAHKNSKNKEVLKDMEAMKGLTQKHNMFQSGGGDSHTREDFEIFAKQEWFARKTIGLVKNMQKKRKLNLKNSSLPNS